MRRRKLLAAAILLAAFLTTVCIGPFPRPLIIVPAFALAWLLVSRRATRLKAACAVVSTSVLLLLWYDVLWTAAQNSSIAKGDLVYRLYDANCTFPFRGPAILTRSSGCVRAMRMPAPTPSSGVGIEGARPEAPSIGLGFV